MKFRIDWGWVVLICPLSIVVLVLAFENTPWLKEQGIQGSQNEASIHNAIGRTAMRNNRYTEAYQQFMTALSIDPELAESYMNLGIIFNLRGDYERAVQAMKKAISLNPVNTELIYNNLGLIYAKQKDYDTALAMFRRSLSGDAESVQVYRNIGEIELVEKGWGGAVDAFSAAIENKPTLENLYHSMRREALLKYKDEDDYDKIREYFSRDVDDELLSEYDAQIAYELAWKDPKLADDFINLGKAFTELDLLGEAIECYTNALKINPEDAVIRNRLGILYARTGDLENAYGQFRKSVELDPGYEDARFNMKKCEEELAKR